MASEVKRKKGRLPKAQQLEKDLADMEVDLSEALLRGNELVAKNYLAYMDTLDKAARGEGNVSETNQISCAKVLTQKAEAYFKEVNKAAQSDSQDDKPSESVVAPSVSLISLKAVGSD